MLTNDKPIKKHNLDFSFKNKKIIAVFLLIIFTAILFFMTLKRYESSKLNINIGDIAESDIRATKDIEDIYNTERLKTEAINNISPKYRISPSVQMKMKDTIANFLDTARDLKLQDNINTSKKADLLKEYTELNLDKAQFITAISMDFKSLNKFENILTDLINQVMGRGIKEDELEYEIENLKEVLPTLGLTEVEQSLGLPLILDVLQPNEFIDLEETERITRAEVNKINPIVIKQNDIIIQKGNIIDKYTLNLIKESGLLKDDNKTSLATIFGMFILLLIGVIFISMYIYLFNNNIIYSNRLFIFLLIIIITIIISQGFYIISPYLMPLPIAALLIAILIEPKLALIGNMFIVTFLGYLLKLDMNIIFMFVLSGSIGVLMFIKQNQRYSILLNGLYIGVINLSIVISFSIIQGTKLSSLLGISIFTLLSGIMSGIIALGTLPLWENTFAVLTPLKLLELSNPNQPLLRKLLLEAPGTYHHSLMVGNLSEAAAEKIDANPLLARVGSYYHDIGKIKRPYYFKENQFGMANPHDKLKANQSTGIITSHTSDGINMAKEAKLPKEIIDIIDQHHGDTLVAYFYYKAKEEGLDNNIDEFRYKGPRPQTKEAALVMLADSAEAAVRSIKDPSKENIEEMVKKVVKGKLNDGQLDECDITNKDITNIINTFVGVLMGIYHDRISYPDVEILAKETN